MEEAREWDDWYGSYYSATVEFFIGEDRRPGLNASRAFAALQRVATPYSPSNEVLRHTAQSLGMDIAQHGITGEQEILLEQLCYLLNESWAVTRTDAALAWAKRSGVVGLRGDHRLLRNMPQNEEARRWLPDVSGFILVDGGDFLEMIGVNEPLARVSLLALAYFVLRGRRGNH